VPTGAPQAITSTRGCPVDDWRWIPPSISWARVWRPAQQRARRGQEGTPGLGTRLKAAAPRLGAGRAARPWAVLTHAHRHQVARDHLCSGSRASRLTSTRPMPRSPPVTTQERPHPPWPRPASRPPPDSPAPDPSMCAAHSSQLLAEWAPVSRVGQPRGRTDHPGLADRIGLRPLPHNAYRSAARARQAVHRAAPVSDRCWHTVRGIGPGAHSGQVLVAGVLDQRGDDAATLLADGCAGRALNGGRGYSL
jgi:hypothetical protein